MEVMDGMDDGLGFNFRISHDNTILIFATLSVRILAVGVSSQHGSRSTRLNDWSV